MNYESGIFHFKGQCRTSSGFIFHLYGRKDQLVESIPTELTFAHRPPHIRGGRH
jgi:hypothetical protein